MSQWGERLSAEKIAYRTARLIADGHLENERALFVHDLDLMIDRVHMMQQAFPENALHGIAVKANPLVSILTALIDAGAGLECASIEEVELSLAAGCEPEKIIFDSPAKTHDEIQYALELGLYLNVDNFDELERVAKLRKHDSRARVGFRVNPEVGSGSIAITSVANAWSKFGVSLSQYEEELLAAFLRHAWLDGLHVHIGSQGCNLQQLVEGVSRVDIFRQKLQTQLGRKILHVDIGGGLPTVYRDTRQPLMLDEYVKQLRDQVPAIFSPDTRILTEFGRSVHAQCGWAVSRVEYCKVAGQSHLAVLHLGADAFMRPVYNPNDWPHEYLVLNPDGSLKQGATQAVNLVGPLCFGGDILAKDVMLPKIDEGDWVIVRDCGAYTLSLWSRHCSRALPKVLAWSDTGVSVLKHAEGVQRVVDFWR